MRAPALRSLVYTSPLPAGGGTGYLLVLASPPQPPSVLEPLPPRLASVPCEGPVEALGWEEVAADRGHQGGGAVAAAFGEALAQPTVTQVGFSTLGRVPGHARRLGVAQFQATKSPFSPA